MSRFYVAKGSSAVNAPFGVGVTATEAKNRNMIIHGYSVASRGADFAADVQVHLIPGYSSLGDNLFFTGTESLTSVYTDDFATDADNWVELPDGDMTFAGAQTVATRTDCLKITADAGGDPFGMKRPTTTTNNVYYKLTGQFYQESGAGISFLALGAAGDLWDQVYDHDAGNNHTCGTEGNWEDFTLYGKADGTDLEVVGVTAKNGTTQDNLGATKYCAFRALTLSSCGDVDDWTPSAETHFGWDGTDQAFSCDAGNGGTLTATATGTGLAVSGDIYRIDVTQADYVAQSITVTAFGDAAWTVPAADGTYTFYAESDGTDTVILTADGTGDGELGTVRVRKLFGADTTPLGLDDYDGVSLSDAMYKNTIPNGDVRTNYVNFPIPVHVGTRGWWMQFSPGGASSTLDVNVFYEIT